METAKHTEGPWHEKDGDIYAGKKMVAMPSVPTTRGKVIIISPEEAAANAQLIAAAPELLEALSECLEILERTVSTDSCDPGDVSDDDAQQAIEVTRQKARAAIAKANGA